MLDGLAVLRGEGFEERGENAGADFDERDGGGEVVPCGSGGGAKDFLMGCYMLGWLWGAIAGMIIRRFRKSAGRRPVRPEAVAPK